ncbi:MAG: hypothetical protein PHX02_02720 [Oscillospiraceae bacterium]|nr:hypothetical protein [Oscillospiraceae bacterium]
MQNDYMNQRPYSNRNIPPNNNEPDFRSELSDMITYRVVYPEIFYKLQPFVLMACDEMDAHGIINQEMIEKMADSIYNDVRRMYPDMVEYAHEQERKASSIPAVTEVQAPFRGRFRRRGLLRDIIEILILSELFRRRRRNY